MQEVEMGLKLIKGSEGHLDYLVVARKLGTVIGLKVNSILTGTVFTIENQTYVGARLRCVPEGDLFYVEDMGKGVVPLGSKDPKFKDVWSQIEWEKADDRYASTQIATLVDGCLQKDPEPVLVRLEDGKLSSEMADFLFDLLGEEFMVIDKAALAMWVQGRLDPFVDQTREAMANKQKLQDAIGPLRQGFGVQAALLRQLENQRVPPTQKEIKPAPFEGEEKDNVTKFPGKGKGKSGKGSASPPPTHDTDIPDVEDEGDDDGSEEA